MSKTVSGPDGRPRCTWCAVAPEFLEYHDREWGFPISNDIRLFEKLCLESFQSGLSWRTILAKRDNFRTAFKNFDFRKVAKFGEADVERLLNDTGIVRHPGKLEVVMINAQQAGGGMWIADTLQLPTTKSAIAGRDIATTTKAGIEAVFGSIKTHQTALEKRGAYYNELKIMRYLAIGGALHIAAALVAHRMQTGSW